MRKSIISLVAAGLIAGIAPAMAQGVPDGEVPTELVLGMVPSREAGQLVDSLDRIADYLSAELLIPVKTFVSTNYVGLIEAMGTGRVDIGMFGPSSLVQAVDLYGAEIILGTVRFGETSYYAQFSVRNDSGITEFSDLVGRTIAFVDPGSSSGYQFPYVFLKNEHGIDANTDMNSIFAGSHDAAVIAMYLGDVDVSLSFNDAREDVQGDYPDILEVTNVLGYTSPIPNDGVVVRSGLDAELVTQIQDALIGLGDSDEGVEMLSDLFNASGLDYVDPEVFNIVREVASEFARD